MIYAVSHNFDVFWPFAIFFCVMMFCGSVAAWFCREVDPSEFPNRHVPTSKRSFKERE